MKSRPVIRVCIVAGLLALAGCSIDIDAPQTPTVAASPTIDRTAVALLFTRTPTTTYTPTQTITPSFTPSVTSTHTATVTTTATPSNTATATATQTPTSTASRTHTITPSLTATSRPTDTATPTPSFTPTPRPTDTPTPTSTERPTSTYTATLEPSGTPTRTPAATASPTPLPILSSTPPIVQLDIPTATVRASLTFTPFPTVTPNLTATWTTDHANPATPPPTPTPGGIYTLTPIPTLPPASVPAPTSEAPAEGDGTFYDPNAPDAGQNALPNAPVGSTGPGGPSIPEQSMVVVSYAGQVVPLLDLPNGVGASSALAEGNVFAMSASGQVAAVGADRWLRINGQPVTASPSSEFGLNDNLSIHDLVWSPDGQHLALQIDAANPSHETAISSGVWVYEPATSRSWQIFRDTFPGQTEQLHQQRRAVAIQWSPNGMNVLVTVDTPLGRANVFMPATHDANEFINALEFSDTTWTLDSSALIVSGTTWQGRSAIGRVALDQAWTYTEYASQQTTGLVMRAAAQIPSGAIAFLGVGSPGTFALYVMQPIPNAPPVQVSAVVNGEIVAAEWNAERTAVLVTIQAGAGYRLWIMRTDGTAQDSLPAGSTIDAAHWR